MDVCNNLMDTPKLNTLNDEGKSEPLKKKQRVTIAEDLQEKCLCIGYADIKCGKYMQYLQPLKVDYTSITLHYRSNEVNITDAIVLATIHKVKT